MAKKSNFQIEIEYFSTRLMVGAVGLFPLRWSMAIGRFIGKIGYFCAGKLTRTAYRNLEIALPDLPQNEKDKIVRGCFESLGRQLGLVSHFRHLTPETVREIVEINGREHFDKAHSTGRGILFFTGHFGSWEVFNLVPPAFGFAMNILVRRIDNPKVEAFVESLRTRFGAKTLDKKSSARTMFRLLGNGELLGIVADLNSQEREGIFVNFFGVPASTTTSVAKLALRTNAVVLPAFVLWDETKSRYLLHLEPPVEIAETGDNETDIRQLTQAMTRVIEGYVRRFPTQWMWIHKRWNTRPAGEKGFY